MALNRLWALTMREALTLTFSDAFLVMVGCFALATVMVPLMRKVAPPKGPVGRCPLRSNDPMSER